MLDRKVLDTFTKPTGNGSLLTKQPYWVKVGQDPFIIATDGHSIVFTPYRDGDAYESAEGRYSDEVLELLKLEPFFYNPAKTDDLTMTCGPLPDAGEKCTYLGCQDGEVECRDCDGSGRELVVCDYDHEHDEPCSACDEGYLPCPECDGHKLGIRYDEPFKHSIEIQGKWFNRQALASLLQYVKDDVVWIGACGDFLTIKGDDWKFIIVKINSPVNAIPAAKFDQFLIK